ncbi:acetate kinase [Gemmobacter aquatilis]|uniref:Acetate kinase n=1 Tax=Gemmobacter aquatilis TaxID=933059 RepID=A0A1H8CAC4_9RHOB|nr:acetate/propionate family kinase [Gemmobacter aquatilis]SEM91047.1 acetate kinase [Gemmobacter aquatilis]
MSDAVLVLNAGSSSIKFAVYPARAGEDAALLGGKITGIGTRAVFAARDGDGAAMAPGPMGDVAALDHHALIARLVDWLDSHHEGIAIVAAGHRVVHGGQRFAAPCRITPQTMADLQALAPLAPLHQPHNLDAIAALTARAPDLPQVACFDTAFHRSQPHLAQLFALPRHFADEGILRYGFHGLSYDYIAGILPDHLGAQAEGRVIVAHLGNGASMCAMQGRKSVASTMGFTALDGLMMGQRCGALDAGVVLHLIQTLGMSAQAVQDLLYHEAGLLGVSGLSNDMATLERSTDPHAREAIALFCYRAARELGSLAAALQGLDALVFTAGIGENSALCRALICDYLGWMGVALDADANRAHATVISAPGARMPVLVLPTNEELVVAQGVRRVLAQG